MFIVKGEIENSCRVVLQTSDGPVTRLDTVDNAGRVGGAGHKDIIVILQAEDRGLVVHRKRHSNGDRWVGVEVFGGRSVVHWLAIRVEKNRSFVDYLGRSYDKTALQRAHIPYPNSLISRPRYDFIPALS